MDIRSDVVAKLAGLLRDGIDVHRCAAAAALGRIGGPVDVLIDALLDEDPDVRTDAAAALARFPDPRAAEQLLNNLLGDPCVEVKESAIEALTVLRFPPLVAVLRRLAVSRDPEIIWDDEKFYDSGWDDWFDIQVRSIRSLGELGAEDAIDEIVVALDDEMGQDLTEVALDALVRMGEPGVAAVIRLLHSKDARQRLRAIECLAGAASPSARQALVAALRDDLPEIRLAAARGLAAHDVADPRLVPLFADPDPSLRAEIVALCGYSHPDRLEALLSDPSGDVRRAVLTVIRGAPDCISADRIVPNLTAMLSNEDSVAAALAAGVLASVTPDTAFETLALAATNDASAPEARIGALKALAGLDDPRRVQVVAALAADGERDVRYQALVALSRMAGRDGEELALTSLIAALRGELISAPEEKAEPAPPEVETPGNPEFEAESDNDTIDDPGTEPIEAPSPTSTLEAILGGASPRLQVVQRTGPKVELSGRDMEFLGLARRRTGKKKADPAPIIAPHLDIRRFAARVAGDVARPEMAAALSEYFSAEDPELTLAALDSLARIAPRLKTLPQAIVDALADKVLEKDSRFRLLALRALGATDSPRALMALHVCLGDIDSFLRIESLHALSAREALDVDRAERLLEDSDPGVRLAAAQALSRIGDNGYCETLADFAFAFEGYHHREVAKILRDLAPQDSSRRMLDILEQPDRRRDWQIAIEVLTELNQAPVGAMERTASR